MTEEKFNSEIIEKQIDLGLILSNLWKERKLILTVVAVFFAIGITIAFLTPAKFTASSTFVPQTNKENVGNLGGLASLAGINLGAMTATDEIAPALYPKIINSVQFKRTLLKTPVLSTEGELVTYSDYYENYFSPGILSLIKKYTIGLPGVILNSPNEKSSISKEKENSNIIQISKEELKHFKRSEDQIEVQHNKKEGTVELRFTMSDPLMAAKMAKAAEELLQKEVIDYKIQSAKEQLAFTQKQFENKKKEFLYSQKLLANFRDRNQNLASAISKNELQRLETDYNFAFNIYTEMAKQLEQAKLQVSKDTPVFTIINPVSIPNEKSGPSKAFIIIACLVLGFLISVCWVLIRENLKNKNNS